MKQEIILVLPYIDENTTSTLRFQSIINEFLKINNFDIKVVILNYPIKKNNLLGLELSQKNNFNQKGFELIQYFPQFNNLQKLSFYFLNNNLNLFWKISQMLRVIFYGRDNFHVNKIDDLIKLLNIKIKNGFVVAFGGPFSLFSIADSLSKKVNYKLILDYRDPWTFGYTPLGGIKILHQIKNSIERNHELDLIKSADLITTVSSSLRSFFPQINQSKVKVVPNGSNFNDTEISKITNTNNFNIMYAGTIYNEQFIDLTFFESFKIFLKGKDESKISLQFIGSYNNPLIETVLNKFNLLHVTLISRRVLKKDLLKFLNESSVFLHLKYGDKKDIISSKQADYLAFRRPILLPKDDYGDISKSIKENKAGFVCNSIDENVEVLNTLYQKFLNKENLLINQPEEFITSINRETIAKDLVNEILNL